MAHWVNEQHREHGGEDRATKGSHVEEVESKKGDGVHICAHHKHSQQKSADQHMLDAGTDSAWASVSITRQENGSAPCKLQGEEESPEAGRKRRKSTGKANKQSHAKAAT